MSAKDNFAQAMKELLNGTADSAPKKEEEKTAAPSSFSSFQQPAKPAEEKKESVFSQSGSFSSGSMFTTPPPPKPAPAPAPKAEPEPVAQEVEEEIIEETPVAEEDGGVEEEVVDTNISFGQGQAPAVEQPVAPVAEPVQEVQQPAPVSFSAASAPAAPSVSQQPAAPAQEKSASADVTIIAEGTTIVGDISVSGNLRVNGDIKGNVKVGALFELSGNVIGDVEAEDAIINGSVVKGDVSVANVFNMDGTTVIVGDVSARSADIDGKIKGNLTLDERGHFQSNSIIMGNLVSGTVIIDEGAMLKGDISITNAQTEDVTVEEPDIEIEI